jgi:hypothetical protein
MAMQPRERVLALGLGVTVGLIVLYWGFGQYQSMFSKREGTVANLEKQVSGKETKLLLIERAVRRRTALEKRSLPTNPVAAQSLYLNWLFGLVNEKLTLPSVTPRNVVGRPKAFQPLAFEVKGQGDLATIVKVLHDFYAANHLHQVTMLNIKPQDKTDKLNLTMHIESIILPGTKRKDTLTIEPGDNLALASFDDYKKAIVERNLFAEYKPPQQPTVVVKATEPTFDLAKLAFLTNVGHGVDKQPFAWITERNANRRTVLSEGSEFEIGGIKGKVKRIDIDNRTVELEIDGKSVILNQYKSLGDTLSALASSRS